MAQADGSIIIDTKINTDGFKDGGTLTKAVENYQRKRAVIRGW